MKQRKFRFVILLAAVCANMLAQADDAMWNKTAAGNYDWTNVVNWLPATTCPNGAGQSAYLTNDIVGMPSIQLRQNITLGTLTAGDAAASGSNYGFIFNNKTDESFTLIFDSGTAGVPALINTGS